MLKHGQSDNPLILGVLFRYKDTEAVVIYIARYK